MYHRIEGKVWRGDKEKRCESFRFDELGSVVVMSSETTSELAKAPEAGKEGCRASRRVRERRGSRRT